MYAATRSSQEQYIQTLWLGFSDIVVCYNNDTEGHPTELVAAIPAALVVAAVANFFPGAVHLEIFSDYFNHSIRSMTTTRKDIQ
jgi:hypothetical protein